MLARFPATVQIFGVIVYKSNLYESDAMRFENVLLYLICLLALFGCQDDEILPDTEPAPNHGPTPLSVRVLKTSFDHVVIGWGPVYDIAPDPLIHTVSVAGKEIYSSSMEKLLKIDGLKPETSYNGTVTVTDKHISVSASFTFTTGKYFLEFERHFTLKTGNAAAPASMACTPDGGYVICGSTMLDAFTFANHVTKLDSLGYEQWSFREPYERPSNRTRQKIITTMDGGYVVVNGESIKKINGGGELLWKQTRFHTLDDFFGDFEGVIETGDGGLITVGAHDTFNEEGITKQPGLLKKFTADGALVWSKTYSIDHRTAGIDIESAKDGGYVVLGSTGDDHNSNMTTTFITPDGEIVENKTHIRDHYDFPLQIKRTTDGYIAVGNANSITDQLYGRATKLSDNGDVVWQSEHTNWFGTWYQGISETEEGDFVVVGHSIHENTIQALIQRIDPDGQIISSMGFPSIHSMFQDVESNGGGITVIGYQEGLLWIKRMQPSSIQ